MTGEMQPEEHIMECGGCESTLFKLGEHGSVWCAQCLGLMSVMVVLRSSSPQMAEVPDAEA